MNIPPIVTAGLLAMQSVSAQNTDSADVYFQKGIEAKSAKLYSVAAKHLEKCIQFNPKFIPAYLENGFVNLEMKRQDNAKMNFEKVCELDPSNQAAIKELMELYYNHHQFDKAKATAAKCNGCNTAEKISGLCSYQREDYGNAIKSLKIYLAKFPTDAEATYTLGRTYWDMEQEKEALPYINKAVLLDDTKSKWAFELGMLYSLFDDYKNALVSFNKAAEKGFVQDNIFKENLAKAYMYAGESEKGEKLMNELLERMPGKKEIIWEMVYSFYERKQYDKSLQYCAMLAKMDATDAKAIYQAGMCFMKKGEKDKGQGMCDKAIEMDPSLSSLKKQSSGQGM